MWTTIPRTAKQEETHRQALLFRFEQCRREGRHAESREFRLLAAEVVPLLELGPLELIRHHEALRWYRSALENTASTVEAREAARCERELLAVLEERSERSVA